MNKNITEKQLVDYLKQLSVDPDHSWITKTLEKYNSTHTPYFLNFLSMRKQIAVLATLTIFIFIAIIFGLLVLNNPKDGSSNLSLSEEQKLEIYRNILANNPQTALATVNKTSAPAAQNENLALGGEADAALDARILPYPYPYAENPYNYSETTSIQTLGTALSRCESFYWDPYAQSTRSVNYNYYDKNLGNSSSKSITYDINNNLMYYGLYKSTNTSSESIDYRGGSYAVRSSYTYNLSGETLLKGDAGETSVAPVPAPDMPTDDSTDVINQQEPDTLELIKMYFGENADIVDIVTENGNEYYIVQNSFETTCTDNLDYTTKYWSQSNKINESKNTIITRTWIDSETFMFNKTESYLNSVTTNNLLMSSSTEIVSRDIAQTEADSIFTFEYNVEVRDLPEYTGETTMYDPNKELQNLKVFVRANPYNIIAPENSEYKLQWISISGYESSTTPEIAVPEIYNYYKDRAFYPQGTLGDRLYASSTQWDDLKISAVSPKTTMSYSIAREGDQGRYFNINVYDSSYSDIDILDSQVYTPPLTKNESSVTVPVNGTDLNGKVYNYTYEGYGGILYAEEDLARSSEMSVIDRGCEGESCIQSTYILIFEYGGQKYVFTESSWAADGQQNDAQYNYNDYQSLRLRAYNTQNTNDFTVLEPIFDQMYIPISIDGIGRGAPGSSGASTPTTVTPPTNY